MPAEPPVKRAVAFLDGQKLFHAARLTFGYTYPSYDIRALARSIRISGEQNRWIHIECAAYDACIDPHDYRPRVNRYGIEEI